MRMKLKTINKNIAAATTAESLSNEILQVSSIRIRAKTTNTQPVLIGDSLSQNYELPAGEELALDQMLDSIGSGENSVDLKEIYVKAGVDGEGVTVIYTQKG